MQRSMRGELIPAHSKAVNSVIIVPTAVWCKPAIHQRLNGAIQERAGAF